MRPRSKIISGGQTGVDRAALEWALAHGIAHGGWCPKGRKAEDGLIPPRFHLHETGSGNSTIRTRWNVRDSDATVIFSSNARLTGGSRKTAQFAIALGKPLLRLTVATGIRKAAAQLTSFIKKHDITVLNVAGPRASEESNLGEFVKAVLSRALIG